MYNYGRERALELREEAPTLTDTELIDQELFIPHWKEGPQVLGAPIQYNNQIYRVFQAHDSTGNPLWNPVNTPSLFEICHTTNPEHAKPWQDPYGISGLYYLNECYIDDKGIIWKQIFDGGNAYNAAILPERWQQVII